VKKINIFCFGFGQVAKNFINKLNIEKYNINLSTTSRNKTSIKKLDNIIYKSYQFDADIFDHEISKEIERATHILISTPPESEKYIIKNFSKSLKTNSLLEWFAYLSSTGVYGNHDGRWVNEDTFTNPTSDKGKKRLKAEQNLMDLNMPLIIFRLSGIYSNEKSVLSRLKKNLPRITDIDNQVSSRIHIEDISNILFESFFYKEPKKYEIFNVTDNYPCSYKEVVEYGCKILNIKKPKVFSFEETSNSNLKIFYKDSKKVSNEKVKKFLNYKLKFPSYIEGLNYIRDNFI
jgi:nucleoside-diphosphate-sugar epimerase